MSSSNGRKAVVITGSRTPFVRAFSEFLYLDTIDLGRAAVQGLLDKTELPRHQLDAVVWGGVIFPSGAPNIGREIVLDLNLPTEVEAYTLTRACASGLQAVTNAVAGIERGDYDVVIAGGSDSTSNAEVPLPRKLMQTVGPVAMNSKAGPMDWVGVARKLFPFNGILPQRPKIAERSTGEVMGESAEKMGKRNEISREAMDEFAARSHHRAAAAMANGRFADEVVPTKGRGGAMVHADTLVRGNTSAEKLAKLRPVFAKDGNLTAGNSSPLTDGAAAVLLMSEEKARELGYTAKASFRSASYVGVDPRDQLLMGPALAMPKALERAGLTLEDIDIVDMHEAFAAQVLSVLKMLASDEFAKRRLGRDKAIGEITPEKLNLHGGSIAIGHPFAATGARMVTTVANELHSTGAKTALLGLCAAGGLGAGAVMEACE